MTEILEDTEIPELQPNYINNQLQEASIEIADAGKEIVLNPDNAEGIIQDTIDSLAERATTISNAADREAIANAVNNNTDLTQEEAEQATDNIYQGLQEVSAEAEMQLQMASQRIEETRVEIDQAIEEVRVKADEAADTTAQASIWGFVGLILGMVFTSAAGYWGSNYAATHNEERM